MASENRVNPWGRVFESAERGYFMGNRDFGNAWITCLLRDPDGEADPEPVEYTKLFFLDEATALAAGHRPCHRCRPRDYALFLKLLNADGSKALDAVLKRERGERESHPRRTALAAKLPAGAMFTVGDDAFLAWHRLAFRWSPGGYEPEGAVKDRGRVQLLTLPSTLRALDAGYRPWVHPSVLRA